MIKGFEGYYPPDFDRLWNEAIFIFDTNVLLDLFRYSPNTRKELLDILEKLDDRIWIPHQFFYEYHRNKMTVHYTIADAYRQSEKQLEKCSDITRQQMNLLKDKFQNLKNRTGVEIDTRIDKVDAIFEEIQSQLSNSREQHESSLDAEPLEEKIAQLFAENFGDPFDDACLQNIRKLAKERIKRGIPPGSSKDSKKEKSDPDGDLIGWFQTIKHADCNKLPIILVTNDNDWFLKPSGKTIGPHPELLQEMYDKASVSCYIYKTAQFVQYAREYLDAQVSDETIEEAETRESYIIHQESIRQVSEHAREVLAQVSQAASNIQIMQAALRKGALQALTLRELSNEALQVAMLPGFDSETLLPELPLFDNKDLRTAVSRIALTGSPSKSTDEESEIPTAEDEHDESNDNNDTDDEPTP